MRESSSFLTRLIINLEKVGYITFLQNDQNTDLQKIALIFANYEQIFKGKINQKVES